MVGRLCRTNPRFPNRSATLCGDSQAVKTMKKTAEVCHAAGGAKPPKSWLLHKGGYSEAIQKKRGNICPSL